MKRALEGIVAAAALVFLTPMLALTALAVVLFMGSPVLFRQPRAGLNGEAFTLLKFRTMRDARATDGTLLPNELRLTRFGKFLRALSLDELPQLWNVLKGEMSFVGPRPLLIEYLPLYSAEQARRHEVRPGITGYAQINGRNAISWDEKFELDVWYVDHRSLWFDAKIVGLTILRCASRKDICSEGHATMPAFRGNK